MASRGLALAMLPLRTPPQQRAAIRRSCRVPHGVVEKVLYANLQVPMILSSLAAQLAGVLAKVSISNPLLILR